MPILAEINPTKAGLWKDTPDGEWVGSDTVVWEGLDADITLFLSLDGIALKHYWDAYIVSFSAPQYHTALDYGGFVELSFGQIQLSPDTFSGNWPPPKQCEAVIRYTATTEDLAITIFEGDIYLTSYDEENLTYQTNAPKYTQNLLDIGSDYNSNTVPYPKAFGEVTHVEPLRLADDGSSRPCYHLGGLGTAADAKAITCFNTSAAGIKTQVTTASAHGWSNGDSITINGTVNFNGTHIIESASGSVFVIPITFLTDNSETLPLHASAFIAGGFAVYDDGVPIQENVVVNGDGSFSLTASPVGKVTMSGTATETDLLGVITWGQGRLVGIDAIDSTNARGTSPAIEYWAKSQMPLIDFMSNICAFFTHYFYIKSGILYLGDMLLDNGAETLTETDYFTASYSNRNAISQVVSSWITHEAYNGFVDEIRMARYIKDIENNVVESLYTISTGTTDGTENIKLVDSGATFSTDGVLKGHVAQNTTDDTSTVIVVVTETELELEDDIFVSGEEYTVGPSFPYGQEINIEPYHDSKSNVSTALQNILSVLSKDVIEIAIPISATLPDPGKKLTFPDTQLVTDTNAWIRARALIYDFDNEEVKITGEGVIT